MTSSLIKYELASRTLVYVLSNLGSACKLVIILIMITFNVGTVSLVRGDYRVTGYHNFTITAENHVTPEVVTQTVEIDVLYRIEGVVIEIDTPTWDDLLVHPDDVVSFNIAVDTASRVDIYLNCSDGTTVSNQEIRLFFRVFRRRLC